MLLDYIESSIEVCQCCGTFKIKSDQSVFKHEGVFGDEELLQPFDAADEAGQESGRAIEQPACGILNFRILRPALINFKVKPIQRRLADFISGHKIRGFRYLLISAV